MDHPQKAYAVPAIVLLDALLFALLFFFAGTGVATAVVLATNPLGMDPASLRALGQTVLVFAGALCLAGALRQALSGR